MHRPGTAIVDRVTTISVIETPTIVNFTIPYRYRTTTVTTQKPLLSVTRPC